MKKLFITILLAFFAMGFVDLVGTASNFLKADLNLSDSQANLLPSLVFFWFLFFSVPTSILMNKIGKKRTVLLSLVVTVVSLLIPIFDASYTTMLVALSLLGIGNALMQTSLNPLMTLIVPNNELASMMTFGQFVKAIASFLAPIICAAGLSVDYFNLGLSWRILFPLYMGVGVLAILCLSVTNISEERQSKNTVGVWETVMNSVRLLGRPFILLSFIAIMCHVGIDVGVNTTAPRLLQDIGLPLEEAAWATSLYFIARTVGCLTGSYVLLRISVRTFYFISLAMIALAMVFMWLGDNQMMLYVGIALVGYGNSNTFSMCFSKALLAEPTKQNEVSGLMIMGLFGGTLFPIAMGVASDMLNSQLGAILVMCVGVAYAFYYMTRMSR